MFPFHLRRRANTKNSQCSFIQLHTAIHPRATTEFIYRYNSHDTAQVYLSFKLATTSREREVSELLEALEMQGMKGYDISDDELAKSHCRYMIGGAQRVENERLFRFGACCPVSTRLPSLSEKTPLIGRSKPLVVNAEFPERPGALRKFLLGMQTKWNISLFHYRNHGAGESNLCFGQGCLCCTDTDSTHLHISKILGRCLLGFRFRLKRMPNSIAF